MGFLCDATCISLGIDKTRVFTRYQTNAFGERLREKQKKGGLSQKTYGRTNVYTQVLHRVLCVLLAHTEFLSCSIYIKCIRSYSVYFSFFLSSTSRMQHPTKTPENFVNALQCRTISGQRRRSQSVVGFTRYCPPYSATPEAKKSQSQNDNESRTSGTVQKNLCPRATNALSRHGRDLREENIVIPCKISKNEQADTQTGWRTCVPSMWSRIPTSLCSTLLWSRLCSRWSSVWCRLAQIVIRLCHLKWKKRNYNNNGSRGY